MQTSAVPTTHTQRRADALGLMAESLLEHGPPQRGRDDRTQIVVHVDAESMAEPDAGATLESGATVSSAAWKRMSCDATVLAMLHKDGDVLDVGRKTRRISPALRRALKSRDGSCRFPSLGCFAYASTTVPCKAELQTLATIPTQGSHRARGDLRAARCREYLDCKLGYTKVGGMMRSFIPREAIDDIVASFADHDYPAYGQLATAGNGRVGLRTVHFHFDQELSAKKEKADVGYDERMTSASLLTLAAKVKRPHHGQKSTPNQSLRRISSWHGVCM